MQINELLHPSKKSITEAKLLNETKEKVKISIVNEIRKINSELSLLEDLDIKQVDGGDWVVWDTETDSQSGATRFASPGEAEEARDAMRRARTPSAGLDDDPADGDSSRTRRMAPRYRAAFLRYSRRHQILSVTRRLRESWTYTLATALGVTVDHTGLLSNYDPDTDTPQGSSNSLEETIDQIYLMAEAGTLYNPNDLSYEDLVAQLEAMNDEDRDAASVENHKLYEAYVLRAYGVVSAAYLGAILAQVLVAAPGAARGAYTGIKNIGKFIRALRTLRGITTALVAGVGAVFGAGVGGIVTGVISFILGTAAIWIAEIILTRSGLGPSIVEYIVNKSFEWDMQNAAENSVHGFTLGQVLEFAATGGDFSGRLAADVISDVPGTTEIQRNLRDVRSELLHDPNARAELARTTQYFPGLENEPAVPAVVTTARGASTTTPGAANQQSAPSTTADIFGPSN